MIRSVEITGSTRTGVIAAPDNRAADAGVAMLRRGGNAVDAAVAAAFAIGVVEPHMSGLGGGTWLVAGLQDPQRYVVVEGPITTPLEVDPAMFSLVTPSRTAGLYAWPAVEGDENFLGPRSVGVPGTVAALCSAQSQLGRLPLRDVMAPAIALAQNGFDVNWFTSAAIVQEARQLVRDPGCAALFLPRGFPLRPPGFATGDQLRQPALAGTLEALAEQGPDVFYHGPVGTAIVEYVRSGGGVLSIDDLGRYRARIHETPLEGTFRGARIVGVPRTGTPTVIEALNLFDIASQSGRQIDAEAVAWAQALRLAHEDRMTWMTADPDVVVPWKTLLSHEYAAERYRASAAGLTGPDPMTWFGGPSSGDHPLGAEPARWGCTSHITAVDREGNVVSLTQTILDNFGARVLDPQTGVLLNDGMTYFDPRPGSLNGIKPDIPGLPALSPVIVEDTLRGPIAALGGAGGRKIISSTAQLIPHLVRGVPAQEAIDQPRVHVDGDLALVDARWPPAVVEQLREAGFRTEAVLEEPTTWNFARMGAITISKDGTRQGGVDKHKPGAVLYED